MAKHPVQPPEWIDSAPVRVSETIDIDATPAEVWRHIADHVSWPEWFESLDRVDITGMPTGVGGQRRVTVRRMPIDEIFTAWDENEHFAFAVVGTKLPFLSTIAESVRIEPTETGCRVVYRQGMQGRRGCGRVIGLLGSRMSSQLQEALANLKARVEG